jgi:hypothetical protein
MHLGMTKRKIRLHSARGDDDAISKNAHDPSPEVGGSVLSVADAAERAHPAEISSTSARRSCSAVTDTRPLSRMSASRAALASVIHIGSAALVPSTSVIR